YRAISGLQSVIVTSSQAAAHVSFAMLPNGYVYSSNLNVFAFADLSSFSVLHSRLHELWVRYFGSTVKDDPTYTVKACFRTFPFPENVHISPTLETAGQAYHDHRAALMVARNEGMTKTYNRFHDSDQRSEDIVRLRELHAEMDCAVLRAY